jgi:hypothetical protein
LGAETGFSGASLIDLRDAGMVQSAESLELQFEAAQQFVTGPGGLNHLQCDRASRLVLLGLIDRTHSALAQEAKDAVASDRRWQPGSGGWPRPERSESCVRI